MISPPDVQQLIEAMRSKGYRAFDNPSGHDLNLVGIRTVDTTANSFNDWITVFYMFDGVWNHFAFPGTTDPGLYYRENPANVRGTAIMKPGQYRGAYTIGLHRGYKALQQKGPITVFRDRDGDEELDTSVSEEHTGIHAVNIHRANSYRASTEVGKWSAGCQVFQDPDHFLFLLSLCEKAKEKFGNSFTYTLLEEGDLP